MVRAELRRTGDTLETDIISISGVLSVQARVTKHRRCAERRRRASRRRASRHRASRHRAMVIVLLAVASIRPERCHTDGGPTTPTASCSDSSSPQAAPAVTNDRQSPTTGSHQRSEPTNVFTTDVVGPCDPFVDVAHHLVDEVADARQGHVKVVDACQSFVDPVITPGELLGASTGFEPTLTTTPSAIDPGAAGPGRLREPACAPRTSPRRFRCRRCYPAARFRHSDETIGAHATCASTPVRR